MGAIRAVDRSRTGAEDISEGLQKVADVDLLYTDDECCR
jgi:hypothetical protein